jgi:hypothetical protein
VCAATHALPVAAGATHRCSTPACRGRARPACRDPPRHLCCTLATFCLRSTSAAKVTQATPYSFSVRCFRNHCMCPVSMQPKKDSIRQIRWKFLHPLKKKMCRSTPPRFDWIHRCARYKFVPPKNFPFSIVSYIC